jgi:predicted dehydrogenase
VVGGGRWARVLLSVLSSLDFPHRLIAVSTANAEKLGTLRMANDAGLPVVPTVDDLLRHHQVDAAVVVNAARLHEDTAHRLIDAGVSVLVEKPLALRVSQVERLYAAAADRGVHVMPALTFLHCSYLERFAQAIGEIAEPLAGLRLEWRDHGSEVRYGEGKTYDPGISVAQDVMPHIWSVLATALRAFDASIEVRSCAAERGGRRAGFELFISGIPCRVVLEREAEARRRHLVIEFSSGRELALDFTMEPGTVTDGFQASSGDPDWDRTRRPLRRQLEAFLTLLKQPLGDKTCRRASMASTALAEDSDRLLKQQQSAWLRTCPTSRVDDDVVYAISELLGPHLYRTNGLPAGDRAALKERVDRSMREIIISTGSGDWLSAVETVNPGFPRD